ncbi:MFS transporter [Paenibacillus sp. FSL K6-0276]|uniref:phosphoglycerate transporter PgtP n=1 Tax=unclassified Paenibacillus TaxID=185978 RepID=UPI0028A61D6E|nr:MFS transporter [Paenibacillus sp.]
MLAFLRPKVAKTQVPQEDIMKVYKQFSMQSLLGVFFGYMAYYIVRSNFSLSTPYLREELGLSVGQVGLLTTCMLVAYGISKGFMSSISDKASPKRFMAFGLILCSLVNVMMGFSSSFWIFAGLVIILGLCQGMGVGPAFITIANWFPKKRKGTITAIWNTSHNLGGGIIAPIVGASIAVVGRDNWQVATYQIPAAIALVFAIVILVLTKGSPKNEGLPPVTEIFKDANDPTYKLSANEKAPEELNSLQIFVKYVLKNKNAWYVSLLDTFVYMVRFGVISFMPIYLLEVKGFSEDQMHTAYLFFEWAAIPSTLLVGYLSDKVFKGLRMPPAVIALVTIFGCLFGYWISDSLLWTTLFAATIGCFIYVPQFLASVQTMEVVPPFAVGSAVGLRGFMSYVLGATTGTTVFGYMVDSFGWHAGFYLLFGATVFAIVFCFLTHFGVKDMERKKLARIQEAS